jgi:DNA-binding transcriptional LysR family regulator
VPALFEALRAGELDALVTSFTSAALASAGAGELVYEPWLGHTYVVIAPAAHALARRRKVTWEALLREPWILPEAGLLARQALDGYFLQAGVGLPQAAITSNHPATNVQMVAAGLGLSAVPEAAMVGEEGAGRVARLRVPLPPRPVATALVYRAGSGTHPALQQLRAAVQATREAGAAAH